MAFPAATAVASRAFARADFTYPLLLVSTSASFAGLWMAAPLIAVMLAGQGASPAAIGLVTALGWGPALLVTPSTPWLAERVGGPIVLHRIAVAVAAISLVLMPFLPGLWWWSVLSVLRGAAGALAWTTADLLATSLAPRGREGRAIGLYQTFVSASVGLGPALASLLGADQPATFLAAAVILLLGLVASFGMQVAVEPRPAQSGAPGWSGPLRLLAVLGVALWAAAASGAFEAIGGAMLPAHAAQAMAFPAGAAAMVAAVAGLGNLLGQYPLGWLADRVAPARLAAAAGVLVGLAGLAWPLLAPGSSHWLALALLGGAGGLFYSLGMIGIAKRLRGRVRACALSWLNAAYILGGALGAPAAGFVPDLLPGPFGLPVLLALVGLLAGFLLARGLRSRGGRVSSVLPA